MNTLLNRGSDAAWRIDACDWEPDQPLCNQVLDYDNNIEVTKEHLMIGEHYVKCLSAKRKPRESLFGDAVTNAGDLLRGLGGVRSPLIWCVRIPFSGRPTAKKTSSSASANWR